MRAARGGYQALESDDRTGGDAAAARLAAQLQGNERLHGIRLGAAAVAAAAAHALRDDAWRVIAVSRDGRQETVRRDIAGAVIGNTHRAAIAAAAAAASDRKGGARRQRQGVAAIATAAPHRLGH